MSSATSLARRSPLIACATLLVACRAPAPQPHAMRSPQPYCLQVFPVHLVLEPEALASAATPHELTLPARLLESVITSGKIRVWYTVGVCEGAAPRGGEVERSTGFPELDRFLDAHLVDLELDLPSSGCATATIILEGFDRACDAPKTLD